MAKRTRARKVPQTPIYLARQAKGWSQERLARETELARDTVRSLEAGTQRPNLDTARRIAKALGKRVDDLFKEAS